MCAQNLDSSKALSQKWLVTDILEVFSECHITLGDEMKKKMHTHFTDF
jgi:hypothetical protein